MPQGNRATRKQRKAQATVVTIVPPNVRTAAPARIPRKSLPIFVSPSQQNTRAPAPRRTLRTAVRGADRMREVTNGTVRAAHNLLRQRAPKDPIAASMMLPHVFPPRRVASQYTSAPTAVSAPYYLEQADWTRLETTVDAERLVAPGSYFAAVSRNPLCAFIEWNSNPTFQHAVYQAQFLDPIANSMISLDNCIQMGSQNIPFQYFESVPSQPFQPHGPTLYAADADDAKVVYLDGTTAHPTIVTFTAMLGTTFKAADTITYRNWNGSAWRAVSTVTRTTTTTFVISINGSGYFGFWFGSNTPDPPANSVTISAQFDISCACMGFHPLPHFDDIAASIEGIRVNAASLMITPHPALLYEGGQCAGVQLPAGVDWQDMFTNNDPFTTISEDANAVVMPLKGGLFGFHKPTDATDFQLTTPVTVRGTEIWAYSNPVSPPGGWLVVAASVGLVDGAYPSGLCYVSACYGVEFRSLNVWFTTLPPQHTVEAFDTALRILRDVPQWHENPTHIRDIMKAIATKGRVALRLAPSILKVLAMLFPGQPAITLALKAAEHVGALL